MDTRFLESFIAVVDHGSIAEAARRLNLTPAAVAQRIRALESEIGGRLVLRSGRTVQPTEAGVAILSRTRNFVRDIRDLRSIAADDAPSGELRLGAITTAMTGLLPDIMSLLVKSYSQIEVYIMPGSSIDLYQKVIDGDLDAAIIVQPPFALPKTCDWQVLREEQLIILAPGDLATKEPHKILSDEPFIRYDRNHWGGRLADAYLRQAGIHPRDRFELDALDAIAVLVDRGLGVSLVPDWAPPWPSGLSLRKIALNHPPSQRRIGLIWRRSSASIRLVHAFLNEAAKALTPTR